MARVPRVGPVSAQFSALLDREERSRVARYLRREDRETFVLAHGGLRWLLGAYLRRPPATIQFVLGPHGKPELPGPPLHFNLSHSGGHVLWALSAAGPVGVDVERHRPDFQGAAVVERFFSQAEIVEFRGLAAKERIPAFWRGWSRKEAVIKADGRGLSVGLGNFDVSLGPACAAPGPPTAVSLLRSSRDASIQPASWHLMDLPPPAQFACALALTRCPADVRGWWLPVPQEPCDTAMGGFR